MKQIIDPKYFHQLKLQKNIVIVYILNKYIFGMEK